MIRKCRSPSARIASGPIYGEGGAGPIEHLPIEVRLGDMVLEKLVVKGIQLSTSRGATLTDLGLR